MLKSKDDLIKEIKIYNILALTFVRNKGSIHGDHSQRCLWKICGKSMLQRALEVPLASKYVNKVVLISEDQEILRVSKKIKNVTVIPCPLDSMYHVPRDWNKGIFQTERPRSLFSYEPFTGGLSDGNIRSGHRDCTYYAMWYLKEQESYVTDIEIIIPANEPMATTNTLDRLIEAFFQDEEANYAHTLVPVMPYLFTINPKTQRPFPVFMSNGLDRQCYPDLYRQGPFRIWGKPTKKTYDEERKIAYIVISKEEAMDIHDEDDLILANHYLKRREKKGGEKVKLSSENLNKK